MRRQASLYGALTGIALIVATLLVWRGVRDRQGRGRQIATANGCIGCHSPPDGPRLSGYLLGVWLAPNITPDPVSGIGAWSRDDLFRYLRHGKAPGKDQASGPMAPVITALSAVSDTDVYALIGWLARQPRCRDPAEEVPAFVRGEPLRQ